MSQPYPPVRLVGQSTILEPLSMAHLPALAAIGLDPDLWKWIPIQVRSEDEMRAYIENALDDQQRGGTIAFATIDKASGKVAGSTRFWNIDANHRRGEIGWTWLAKPWQRSALNTEAKYLMMKHAFEVLKFIRVEIKTDSLNETSRKAIARLGAKEEGILRNHMIVSTGRIRHTVYFSVIESEWPAVKAGLEAKMSLRR